MGHSHAREMAKAKLKRRLREMKRLAEKDQAATEKKPPAAKPAAAKPAKPAAK